MKIKILPDSDTLSFYNIRRSIISSFVITTIFAVILVGCILFLIENRENDSKTIDLANRQRVLGQKIITDIYALQVDMSTYDEIDRDTELWDSVQRILRYGNWELGIQEPTNPGTKNILEDISLYRKKLYRFTEQQNPGELDPTGPAKLRAWEEGFMDGMDRLVGELRADAEKNTATFKYMVSLLMAFFVLFIFGLYKFFVKPIIKGVRFHSEEREKQARHIHSILENTPNPIWSVDLDYNLIAHNMAFSKRTSEEQGKVPKIGESVLGRNTLKRKKLYDRAFKGESFRTEYEMKKQGRTTYHELSFNPIYGNQGRITGCSVNRMDVTRRVKILQELQKSEAYLKEAQEIANMGNWNWDMVGNKIEWSDQLYKVFGQDRKTFEADYQGLMDIIHPEDREAFDNDVRDAIENDRPHDIVHRIVLGDGDIRYIHQMGKVFYDTHNKPVRMAGTSQDVTVLENAKERIMKQYDDLQNFVYIISHNVRAPIATLQSLVDIFEPRNGERDGEIIAHIGTTVDALDRTIKDLNHALSLRNVSRDTFEEVDLLEILKDIELLLAGDILANNVKVEYNLSKAPKLIGIKSYFANILFNLISNAIDYRAETRDPHITVSSRPTPTGGAEIVVVDNGLGMALNREKRKKIFDMYGRLSGASKGKGMGLYLVRTQVETMNGQIQVESEPDMGSVFTLVFDRSARPRRLYQV